MGLNLRDKNKKLDNKGMSFVEILVVMAIMVIVAGASIAIVSLINSGDAKKGAKTVNSQLNDLKNKTLSIYGSWHGEIGVNDDESFEFITYKNDERFSSEVLGSRVVVTFYAGGELDGDEIKNYAKEYTLTAGNNLKLVYAQATGAVEQVMVGSEDVLLTNDTLGIIKVSSGDQLYYLKLYYKTGKVIADI